MMKKILSFALANFAMTSFAATVTFQVNMNGYSGFSGLAVSGTFNNWCGNCNLMSDSDGDGIWSATVAIPDGSIQYKFSFGNWAGQENLTSASGCVAFDGPFVNRQYNAQGNATMTPVCWGLCTNCLAPDTDIWELSWSDEFDGTSLDLNTWTHEFGASGWGNNELQNYTSHPGNLSVADGMLTISARQNSPGNYTSARIITNNKVELKYGKIEGRIKVPTGQGIWPAFWMLGANFESVSWPDCGEIDIMEHVNNEPLTNSAIHWQNGGHTYRTNSIPYERNVFHTYGAIWDESSITFTIDDIPFWTRTFTASDNSIPIFQRDFFFILNIAVGGNWPGNPDGTTVFPANMDVDYIRVYQPSALSVSSDLSKQEVKLFPIPARDQLNVQFESADASRIITVYDITGKEIAFFRSPNNLIVLETSAWVTGVYMMKVTTDKEVKGITFLKD